MTQAPATLEQAFARIRIAAEADAAACAHVPAAVEAMLLALLLRLLGQLERMARAWQARAPRHAGLSRSRARIASGLVPPRAERPVRFGDWWLPMHPGRGMRPAPAPSAPPRPRAPGRRATPPPEPAPA